MLRKQVGSGADDEEGNTMTRRAEGRRGRPPLPPGVKNERFSCYVPEAVREALDALADEQHTTRTNLVRAILTDYVATRRPLPAGVRAGDAVRHAAPVNPADHGTRPPAGARS